MWNMGDSCMKLEFLGYRQEGKKAGCPVCGKRTVSKYTFHREKRMVLPSGRTMTFFVGHVYIVNDSDGDFLLSQGYYIGGIKKPMFKDVE